MNRCKSPRIPPIISDSTFIFNCKDKARIFNNFFANQCKVILNNSILPEFEFITNARLSHVNLSYNKILSLVKENNPNKAAGSDGISGQMLLICNDTVIPPLQIIFNNILDTCIYPDLWKLANVSPIFKKGNKQLVNNYLPISLLPICGKLFEKIVFNDMYSYSQLDNLITKNQSGFRPGDSTTNQLLFLLDDIF